MEHSLYFPGVEADYKLLCLLLACSPRRWGAASTVQLKTSMSPPWPPLAATKMGRETL